MWGWCWPQRGALGCMTSDAEMPMLPAPRPMLWVDPARCLPSCTHPDDPDLVLIDGSARATPGGAFRVRADVAPALSALFEAAAASWGALSNLQRLPHPRRTGGVVGRVRGQRAGPRRAPRPQRTRGRAGGRPRLRLRRWHRLDGGQRMAVRLRAQLSAIRAEDDRLPLRALALPIRRQRAGA